MGHPFNHERYVLALSERAFSSVALAAPPGLAPLVAGVGEVL